MGQRVVAYKPGKVPGTWIQARATGGHCFTVSWNRLARMLQVAGTMAEGETIIRFEVDRQGVTVFMDGGSGGATFRYLPYEKKRGSL